MYNQRFPLSITCHGKLLDLSIPRVMGILNVTPDSFSDGGQFTTEKAMLLQVEKMVSEGADIIDIGGMSSRPGAKIIGVKEECERVLPAIRAIRKSFSDIILSVDTLHSETAQAAWDEGMDILNDISGGDYDPGMLKWVAGHPIPWIVMHMPGTPETMAAHTSYSDVTTDVLKDLDRKVYRATKAGIRDIVVDPGFGFGKTTEQNYQLLSNLEIFHTLNCPLLVGFSRKSMIRHILQVDNPLKTINGTTVLNTIALDRGASILRVHDVREAAEAVKLYSQLRGQKK